LLSIHTNKDQVGSNTSSVANAPIWRKYNQLYQYLAKQTQCIFEFFSIIKTYSGIYVSDYVAHNCTFALLLATQPTIPVTSVFGWIIIHQKTMPSSISWSRNWQTYKNGFGSIVGDGFWLGLDRMHLLTSGATYRLRVELLIGNGQWISAEYQAFSVGSEQMLYKLHVSGYVSIIKQSQQRMSMLFRPFANKRYFFQLSA